MQLNWLFEEPLSERILCNTYICFSKPSVSTEPCALRDSILLHLLVRSSAGVMSRRTSPPNSNALRLIYPHEAYFYRLLLCVFPLVSFSLSSTVSLGTWSPFAMLTRNCRCLSTLSSYSKEWLRQLRVLCHAHTLCRAGKCLTCWPSKGLCQSSKLSVISLRIPVCVLSTDGTRIFATIFACNFCFPRARMRNHVNERGDTCESGGDRRLYLERRTVGLSIVWRDWCPIHVDTFYLTIHTHAEERRKIGSVAL